MVIVMCGVQAVLFAVAVLESVFLLFVLRKTHVAWPATRIAGTCLLLLVVAWVAIARLQLGRSFSVTPQARRLVTTGLYARIRNPIYVASPFLVIGLALVLDQWWPLLLLLALVPIQMLRARREAAVLHAAFGQEYERYRAQTWF